MVVPPQPMRCAPTTTYGTTRVLDSNGEAHGKRNTCGSIIDVSACATECIKQTEGQSSTHHQWGRSPSINTPGFPSVWYRLKCLYFLLLLTVNQGQLLIVEISLDIIVLLFLIFYTCKTKRIVVSIEMIFVFWLIRI